MKEGLIPFLLAVIIALAAIIGIMLYAPPLMHSKWNSQHQGQEATYNQSVSQKNGIPVPINIECDPNCSRKEPDSKIDQNYVAWFADKLLSDPISLLTAILAFLNGWLVVLVSLQVRDARKSPERQLRAYVFVDGMNIVDGSQVPPPHVLTEQEVAERANRPVITLGIKNTGQTPAYEVIHWTSIDVIEISSEQKLIIPEFDTWADKTYLAVGSTTTQVRWFPRPLTMDEINGIMNLTHAVYAFGRIEYRDAFRKKRFTIFRFKYNGFYPPLIPSGTVTYCREGNKAN